jgi:hypothetical protein
MLQIDHIYEFLYQKIFNDFEFWFCAKGVIVPSASNTHVFTNREKEEKKIFFYDQEPFVLNLANPYMEKFIVKDEPIHILTVSEISPDIDTFIDSKSDFFKLYYFFHGFAALDWYRGYYALNYNKTVVRSYKYSFISMNRIINNDRSYRIYLVSKLKELGLLDRGLVSFNVTDNAFDDWRDEVNDPNTKLSEKAKQHATTFN